MPIIIIERMEEMDFPILFLHSIQDQLIVGGLLTAVVF